VIRFFLTACLRFLAILAVFLEWGATLEEALQKVFGESIDAKAVPQKTAGAHPSTPVLVGATNEALQYLNQYFSLMGQGKPKEAGEKLEQLRQILLRQVAQK